MELFYHRWNQPEEIPSSSKKIILLHGMGGTGALWRPISATLENEMNVIAPDQRGHGKSQISFGASGQKNVGYTPLDYGQDVIDTIETLEFYSTWILGHSMGVRTAVAAASLKPDWIEGLFLVDLGLSGVAGGGLGDNLAQFLRQLPLSFPTRQDAKAFMEAHCPDPSIAQYLLAVSVKSPDGTTSFPFDHQALVQTVESARNTSLRTWLMDLGKRGMPILILRGARSLVWSHEEFENEKLLFKEYNSIHFLEIANAGHGLPFEQRAVFLQTILEFMKSKTITS
jgi:pimeloyl-ACP methyl ester carboxylesterase